MKRALAARCAGDALAARASADASRCSSGIADRPANSSIEQRVRPAHEPREARRTPRPAVRGRRPAGTPPPAPGRHVADRSPICTSPSMQLGQVETDRGLSPEAEVDQDEVGGRVAHEQVARAGVAVARAHRHRAEFLQISRHSPRQRPAGRLPKVVVESGCDERVGPQFVAAQGGQASARPADPRRSARTSIVGAAGRPRVASGRTVGAGGQATEQVCGPREVPVDVPRNL